MDQDEGTGSLARQGAQSQGRLARSRVQRVSVSRGPLPAPEALAQYDNVLPGAAERILQMTEGQVRHRQNIETAIVNGDSRRAYLGIVLGTLVALGALGAAAYAISQGEALVGGGIVVVDIVGILGTYIYGTRAQMLPSREPEAATARDVETTQG